jgi:hypothetical protein
VIWKLQYLNFVSILLLLPLISFLELSRPLADTIRRTAVEVAMKTQLVPQHFEQPVDELEFALNGMIQLHEDQLILLRDRIAELELQLAACSCGSRMEKQVCVQETTLSTPVVVSENEALTPIPLPAMLDSEAPTGGLDSDQMSVMSDSSATNTREFNDVRLLTNAPFPTPSHSPPSGLNTSRGISFHPMG